MTFGKMSDKALFYHLPNELFVSLSTGVREENCLKIRKGASSVKGHKS